jgi:hypothetical protein
MEAQCSITPHILTATVAGLAALSTVTRLIGVAVAQLSYWWCTSVFRTQFEQNISDLPVGILLN